MTHLSELLSIEPNKKKESEKGDCFEGQETETVGRNVSVSHLDMKQRKKRIDQPHRINDQLIQT
jgi:hypothetical protein